VTRSKSGPKTRGFRRNIYHSSCLCWERRIYCLPALIQTEVSIISKSFGMTDRNSINEAIELSREPTVPPVHKRFRKGVQSCTECEQPSPQLYTPFNRTSMVLRYSTQEVSFSSALSLWLAHGRCICCRSFETSVISFHLIKLLIYRRPSEEDSLYLSSRESWYLSAMLKSWISVHRPRECNCACERRR
jgi:hypothetical protein